MKKVLALALLLTVTGVHTINAQNEEKTSKFIKTDEVLAKAAEKAINLAEKTGEFVIDQAPELLKEFYQWHIFSDIFWIIFGIIIILTGRYLPYLWLGDKNPGSYTSKYFGVKYDDDPVFGAYITFGTFTILGLLILLLNLYNLIYILVAPKLYLIDYFIK